MLPGGISPFEIATNIMIPAVWHSGKSKTKEIIKWLVGAVDPASAWPPGET
jgi:hypothetical protein